MGKLKQLLDKEQVLILDGPLGTELEELGYDISGKLWSAKYLLEDPNLIKTIHQTYLEAGADLLTSASYQATIPGLIEAGLNQTEAEKIITSTVSLAQDARTAFWQSLTDDQKAQRPHPLVLGDVGPYAAYLANGSEYSGDYGEVDLDTLKEFHRPRIQLLVDAGSDALALETIPNTLEVTALLQLLAEDFPQVDTYLSLTSPDGKHLPDGTSLTAIAEQVNQSPQVLVIGINCSSPLIITEALTALRQGTDKPFIVYPNSGEIYDGQTQTWSQATDKRLTPSDFAKNWQKAGAQLIGGCCRTRPEDIKNLSKLLR